GLQSQRKLSAFPYAGECSVEVNAATSMTWLIVTGIRQRTDSTVSTVALGTLATDAHDHRMQLLKRARCFGLAHDLQVDPLRGVEAQELVQPLPNLNREQTARHVARERLPVEHLGQLIEPTHIALDHPQACCGVDRPQPLERGVDLRNGEPELLLHHSHRL